MYNSVATVKKIAQQIPVSSKILYTSPPPSASWQEAKADASGMPDLKEYGKTWWMWGHAVKTVENMKMVKVAVYFVYSLLWIEQ